MSFSGRVSRESHLGGLLIDFEGKPPRLGARIRISGGKIIGRVDTVLGPVGSALIHIHPLYNGIDARASVGSPVEIAPRDNSHQGRPRGRHSSGNFRERGGPRKGSSRDNGGRTFRDNKGVGRGNRGSGGKGGRTFRDNKGVGRGDRGSGGKGGRTFRDNKGVGRGDRGPNQPRRGPKGENRSSNNSRRRRDSGKSGRGRRR